MKKMMTQRRNTYRLIICYDGTRYHGWQVQPNDRTIAGTIIKTFEDVFSHSCTLLGASRTDTGVHAYHQVARLTTDFSLSAHDMKRVLNNALPDDILLREVTQVDPSFHPHQGVVMKEYTYRIFTQRPLPFDASFGWYPAYEISRVDWDRFQEALACFVGTHNFASFCKNDEGKETVRTVSDIVVEQRCGGKELTVTILGKGFLQYQIRRMLGAALTVASRTDVTVALLQRLLKEPEPTRTAFHKAPAQGLRLQRITYE